MSPNASGPQMDEEYRDLLNKLRAGYLAGQQHPLETTIADTRDSLSRTDHVCRPCVDRLRRAVGEALQRRRNVR